MLIMVLFVKNILDGIMQHRRILWTRPLKDNFIASFLFHYEMEKNFIFGFYDSPALSRPSSSGAPLHMPFS